jgi:uncharacterized RDD family membrane protein YckC/RNA polymerase subunit RPABC4/transcription elongation factor Spt4
MNNQCPNCSSSFTEKTKFCKICGSNLQKEVIENPTCPLCNEVFSSDIKFCIQDGTLLVHPDKLIPKCVVCKKAYTNGTKFCPNDGGKIELENKLAPLKTTPQIPIIEPVKQIYQEQTVYSNPSSNSYNKAPLGKRFLAYLLDSLIIIVLFLPALFFLFGYIASLVSSQYYDVNPSNLFLGLLLLLLPLWYGLIKDGLGEGQSWGKSAVDLMVVNVNTNEPCSKLNSTGRNILFSIIWAIPYIGALTEIIMVFANPEGRKLSDLGASTQVIELKEYKNN